MKLLISKNVEKSSFILFLYIFFSSSRNSLIFLLYFRLDMHNMYGAIIPDEEDEGQKKEKKEHIGIENV